MSVTSLDATVFAARARQLLEWLVREQLPAIRRGGQLLADVIGREGVVHCFGTGHSQAIGMELAGRAGGLVPVNLIAIKDLVLHGGEPPAYALDPESERNPEVARRLWRLHRIRPEDCLVLISNSGRNATTVEMGALARREGLPVVAITSLQHSHRVTSTHPSGKRLFEIADVVIDNGAPYGDALIEVPGGGRICAASTLTGVVIAQMMVAEAAGILVARGQEVPALISLNVPDSRARNDALRARYAGRVLQSEP